MFYNAGRILQFFKHRAASPWQTRGQHYVLLASHENADCSCSFSATQLLRISTGLSHGFRRSSLEKDGNQVLRLWDSLIWWSIASCCYLVIVRYFCSPSGAAEWRAGSQNYFSLRWLISCVGDLCILCAASLPCHGGFCLPASHILYIFTTKGRSEPFVLSLVPQVASFVPSPEGINFHQFIFLLLG